MSWAWSPAQRLELVPGGGAGVYGLGGCLRWLASARPPGHGISQSFYTKVLEEFVFEASRAAMAHEISNPSVRKFRKGSFLKPEGSWPVISNPSIRTSRSSFLRPPEGLRHRYFPNPSVRQIVVLDLGLGWDIDLGLDLGLG